MLIAAIGLAAMGCVASGCYQLWFTNMLQRKGMALHGTIVDRIPRGGQGSGTISYRYEFEGKVYLREQRITTRHIDNYDPGDGVTVYCLPRHPARARIGDTSWYSRMILLGTGIALLILLALGVASEQVGR